MILRSLNSAISAHSEILGRSYWAPCILFIINSLYQETIWHRVAEKRVGKNLSVKEHYTSYSMYFIRRDRTWRKFDLWNRGYWIRNNVEKESGVKLKKEKMRIFAGSLLIYTWCTANRLYLSTMNISPLISKLFSRMYDSFDKSRLSLDETVLDIIFNSLILSLGTFGMSHYLPKCFWWRFIFSN